MNREPWNRELGNLWNQNPGTGELGNSGTLSLSLMPSSSQTGDPESNRVRVRIGRHLVTMTARQHADIGDEPSAAAQHAQVSGRRPDGISRRRHRVVARVVSILHPLPYVAGDV